MRSRCHASRAASRANVLPAPAGARTTSTPRPLFVSAATSSCCSPLSDGRALIALCNADGSAIATPASVRRAAAARVCSFDCDQFACAEPLLAGNGRQGDDRLTLEKRIGERLEVRDGGSIGGRFSERLKHVASAESRPLSRQPIRALERGRDPLVVQPPRLSRSRPPQRPLDMPSRESVLGGARAPLLTKPTDRHVPLRSPSLQRRDLRGASRPLATLSHVLKDLAAPLREVLDHAPRHHVEIGDSVQDRPPLKPQPFRDLPPQRHLVQVIGRRLGYADSLLKSSASSRVGGARGRHIPVAGSSLVPSST